MEKACWEACFFATGWSIWLMRNEIIFKDKQIDEADTEDLIKTKVAIWVKAAFDLKEYYVEDFKRSLNGIRCLKVAKIVR